MAEPIINVLGIVGMENKGAYDADAYYEKLNVVSYQGSSYCALDSVHNVLPTDTTKWQLIAEKGDKGDTGDDGYTPVKGTDYYTAEDIAELESTLSDDVTSEVTEQLGGLTSTTPLVASSTAGMTDTTRIYVNTTDGHWYWYDGAAWQDGGLYQSTGIDDNSITRNKLKIARYCKIISGADAINLTLNNGILTINNPNSKIIQYEDNFFSCPASSDSKEINNNTLYYIVVTKISSAYALKIYDNTEFQAIANRNETFILATYYGSYLNTFLDNDEFINIQHGIRTFRKENQYVSIVGDGFININTTDKRAEITPSGNPSRFYLFCPSIYQYNRAQLIISSQVNVDMLNSQTAQTLFFNTKTQEFIWLDSATKGFSRLIPILTYFGGKISPIIEPSHIKVNGQPYYRGVIDINVEGAVTQTINQCMKDITNPDNTTKIVLVGDSITHGMGGTGFAQNGETIIGNYKRNPNGYCWAKLFKNYIENNYNATVTNNGCTGTNIQFLATNISTLIPSDTDIAIISYCTNNRISHDDDVGNRATDLESIFDTLTDSFNTIITYCLNNNIKFVIQTPPPASSSNEALHNRVVHIYDIVNIIQKICADKGVEYNNVYDLIYYYCWDNNIDWNAYLSDGLHPNDAGYRVMFYKILQGLNLAPSYVNVS